MLVSSVPLSLTMVVGRPRRLRSDVSSRVTRGPESEVSATSARRSRLKSSTMASTRNRRPSVKASETKSRLQRSLGRFGTSIGRRAPVRAYGRHACELADVPRCRAVGSSSGSLASPGGRASRAHAGSRTGAAQPRPPSSHDAAHRRPAAGCGSARSTGRLRAPNTPAAGSPRVPHTGAPRPLAWQRASPFF